MLLLPPTPEQRIHTKKIFNESENVERDLEEIKQWLREQPHLPDSWDDSRLLTFLRGCRFSLPQCKKKLEMYFTVRSTMPELFSNRNIANPGLQEVLDVADGAVLPHLTPDCGRVSIIRAARPHFETPTPSEFFKLVFMIGDLRLELEEFGVPFDVYILDAGFPWFGHFLKVSPFLFRKAFICIQEAYPVVIKEVHIVNANSFIDFAISSIKPFLNESLRNAIHVHRNVETLYDFVPRDILPEEYGGSGGKLTDLKQSWIRELEKSTQWFEEQEDIKASIKSTSFWSGFFGL
ncbi:alpha-tocopherol transfer protein-like [Tribolium castaneum]|uniref:Alpha-tocopherol transfer protein-like n=1 Tax=Tribolium castaneum TaxID=7070 RepID=D2A4J6_TRICA|nr:PREDICTED: alpha-tocopherol transfer protein-like [Tribolium castaneum]EFA05232.2 Alpha-tocopherol transfer protein-like [Tribolium castaneum]|eukprot:XP_968368.1 PREDICTED: alpha-tocopherol transfer protein-like [Tribolium castaneum]